MTQVTETKRWWIAIAVMLTTVIEVLDSTIVNVSLPNMMGSLAATSEQITWVLTSYIVSAAIVMPLSGFLINYFGAKKLLLINIVGFMVASMLCGMANSLPIIVLFRVLQGLFGAALVPLSQFILRYTFPPEQITKAMAIWGVGVMTGPIAGPTLGGYITAHLNWRWLFYVNVPVCLIAWTMCNYLISETPRYKKNIDYIGIILLAISVGALQIFLDRGNTVGWFDATSIQWLCGIFIIGWILFIVRGLNVPDYIINLRLFTAKNFSFSCIALALYCGAAIGTVTLQPLFMERLMNYPIQFAGWVMAPRGIASAIAMALVPRLIKHVSAKTLILMGIFFSIISTWQFANITTSVNPYFFVWIGILHGFGMGLVFVPISTLAFKGFSSQLYAEASGLFSFARSLGISIGISLLITLLTRETQIHWNTLNSHIQPFNLSLHQWLAQQHLSLTQPLTLIILNNQIGQQASFLAFINTFYAVILGYLFMLPFILMMRAR